MPLTPTREQLRTEFDAAVQDLVKMRPTANLTSAFYAAIGDSVFEAGVDALQDSAALADSTYDPSGHEALSASTARLHVVSAPVGSGKTSFAMALITAVVRLQEQCDRAVSTQAAPPPFGCLWVVDQIAKADEMYRDLSKLLPGKVAVWSSDHEPNCKRPTKVLHPTAQFNKDDLQRYPVAIITSAFFSGKGNHKARQVLRDGKLEPRALTVIDERPEEVTMYDIELSAAQAVRELVQADERFAATVGPHMNALVSFMHPRTFGGSSIEKPTDEKEAWKAAGGLQWFASRFPDNA